MPDSRTERPTAGAMPDTQTLHSAAPSFAGYLYQARLALAEALRYAYADSGVEIAVEKFDDVSFEKNGTPLELLQTKHRLTKAGDLTDSSVDLWKTLRVWAEAAKADPSLPGRTRFALLTTAQAPAGSAASHLRPADARTRDVGKRKPCCWQRLSRPRTRHSPTRSPPSKP
ncbi:MAG: hypothetical protein OXH52_12470 [Gammaproteobacteria bacterium]|nr:hypothetical protein [Gammaproteobacteria bacterium]